MEKQTKNAFRRLATMIDCSRNAVMNVESVKRWIDLTADMGYNALLLYTEDTYEVDNNPYFGYMRGRYTQEELKEIDDYTASKGMELIPCIQTLAHLKTMMRWPAYKSHVDADDVLLVGDEAVYELIENMFAAVSKCFRGKTFHVGLDEAYMLGRGKYHDLHGENNAMQVLLDHMKRVAKIAEKYDYTLLMWSDMFFNRGAGGVYHIENEAMYDLVAGQIPENIELVYWEYRSQDKNNYDKVIRAHDRLKENTWFAGGGWTWVGFAPHNGYSIEASKAAIASCKENGVQDVVMTMWGNDGCECSRFTILPTLFYVSELAKGNTDDADIRRRFKEKYGIPFERFMLVDLLGTPNAVTDRIANAEKYLFYNDCFIGLMDSTLSGGENEQYGKCARRLALMKKDPQWGYLFGNLQALCEVLAIKAELGTRTREVYKSGDKEALEALIADYKKLSRKIKAFYKIYKKQWFGENKALGFEVQDMRLGGVIGRIESCTERLEDYRDGKLDQIEELEEIQLDLAGGGTEFSKRSMEFKIWSDIITANVV